VGKLVEYGVSRISDLYYLNRGDISDIVGSALGDKLYREISIKSEMPVEVFLAALGISGLGVTTSKALVKAYPSLEDLLGASVESMGSLDGIGRKTSSQIVSGLKSMTEEICELQRVLDIEYSIPVAATGGNLWNMSFCITGKLSVSRSETSDMIIRHGGTVKSSVTKNVDFLVIDDRDSSTTKAKKARSLGIKIIEEENLLRMVNGEHLV